MTRVTQSVTRVMIFREHAAAITTTELLCYDKYMNTAIQPGLLRIFRYFTGIAMMYFATLVVFTAIQAGESASSSQMQLTLNLLTNVALSIYLSLSWLHQKLKAWYLPIALMTATIVPVFSNFFYLAEPMVKDLPLLIVRSWLLFPILIVPMVLIAWQYGFRWVLVVIVLTAVIELLVLLPVVGGITIETLPILGVPLIRAFAFGTVGHIVAQLVRTQHTQSKSLIKANYRLSLHAETLEQLTLSRERNRLARELHDTLAHTLSGQIVNLEAIKLMVPDEQAEIQNMLDRALLDTRSGLHETRRAVKDLRSLPLEDLGLAIAIRNLALEAASRADFELKLKINEKIPELPAQVEQSIYRIAQESLENIVRHSEATKVLLTFGVDKNRLRLEIQDNGVGSDLDSMDYENRLGLRGMQERAAEIQGTFDVYSLPDQGMTIQFSIKVPDDQGADL